jgi:predicted component of type VI protein secretion system
MHFWIEYRAQRLELQPGVVLIGRSPSCQIVLDDGLVSRRHAQIVVSEKGAVLEDCGSVNGVFVNERRIEVRHELSSGDRIVIGKQQLVFRTASAPAELSAHAPRFSAETLAGFQASPMQGDTKLPIFGPTLGQENEDSTKQGHAIELLSGVVDKVLALGRGSEAERILSSYLSGVLEATRAGGSVDAKATEKSAIYAVKLAAATGKGAWVDYAIELYQLLKKPLPVPVVDELYVVLRKVSPINLTLLRQYCSELRESQSQLGPADRFVAQRIEGLLKIAALK